VDSQFPQEFESALALCVGEIPRPQDCLRLPGNFSWRKQFFPVFMGPKLVLLYCPALFPISLKGKNSFVIDLFQDFMDIKVSDH